MKILDLGCGENKIKGAIGLDNVNLKSVDIVHDLIHFPYPFESKSIDIIYLRHVIEHFDINDINKILIECHRILINGGKIEISVPHTFSIAAYTDITHKTFFTFNSGNYFDKNHSKSYYKDWEQHWTLINTDCDVTWFDWKQYQLRRLDSLLSNIIKRKIQKALTNINNPSLADRLIKKYSLQFVEIQWSIQKLV